MLHVSLKPGPFYWDVNEADLACFKRGPPQGHTALSNVLLMPSHCSLIPWERRGGGTDDESNAMCFKKGGGMEKCTWIGKIRTRERERERGQTWWRDTGRRGAKRTKIQSMSRDREQKRERETGGPGGRPDPSLTGWQEVDSQERWHFCSVFLLSQKMSQTAAVSIDDTCCRCACWFNSVSVFCMCHVISPCVPVQSRGVCRRHTSENQKSARKTELHNSLICRGDQHVTMQCAVVWLHVPLLVFSIIWKLKCVLTLCE